MAQRIYNVALIGYGLSAKVFQIPFVPLVPQFKLDAIVQRHPKPNDDAAHDHPDVKVYRSTEELFEDEEVDVVMIGTSSDSHYTLCKQALEAGKHGECH
jgi:predicted dehydrogenase